MEKTLPIVIHDDILSRIYNYYLDRKINNTVIAYGVYVFLYKTVRIQGNNRVYATDTFIKKGTGIGSNKLKEIKRDLKDIGLIETIRPRNKQGMYEDKSYLEVKFVWKPETLDRLFCQESNEMIQYKIAKELLLTNFPNHEEIQSNQEYPYAFPIFKDGREDILYADTFYFDDEFLKCEAEFGNSGNIITYTVPSDRVMEIILELADSYSYNFAAVKNVLSSKI